MTGRSKYETPEGAPVTDAGPPVKVSPAANYQIAHAGDVAGPGEFLEVPADVAEKWRALGLVK